MTPSIGRIVHYQHTSGQVCPALIISVGDNNECALQVFRETESYVNPKTPYESADDYAENGEEHKAGTWHWPPRV